MFHGVVLEMLSQRRDVYVSWGCSGDVKTKEGCVCVMGCSGDVKTKEGCVCFMGLFWRR